MDIQFKPHQITKHLIGIVVFLTTAHLVGLFFRFALPHSSLTKLLLVFDLDGETNIPSFYSTATMLFCSFLLSTIALASRGKNKPYLHWKALSYIFLYLSADEMIQIHERLIVLRKVLHLSGIFYYAWVVPYSIMALVIALCFRKFVFELPRPMRRLFILAGATYVMGAVGCEMIGGGHVEAYGWTLTTTLIATLEEVLEMSGIILFAHALMLYLQENFSLRMSYFAVADLPPQPLQVESPSFSNSGMKSARGS